MGKTRKRSVSESDVDFEHFTPQEMEQLMLDEKPTVEEVFSQCDTNSNGKLNYKEVKTCLTQAVASKGMTKKDMLRAAEVITRNAYIPKAKFLKALTKKDVSAADAEKIYEQVDKNADGKCTYKEIKKALVAAKKAGELGDVSLNEAKDYLRKYAVITKAGMKKAIKQF